MAGSPCAAVITEAVPWRSSGPTRTTWASGSRRAASSRCSIPFPAAIRPTYERRAERRRECRGERGVSRRSRSSGAVRLGEAVAAYDDALGAHAAGDDVVPLARGRDDDDLRARRDASCDESHRRRASAEPCAGAAGYIPSGSNTYGMPRSRHQSAVTVVTGSRNPKTWATSRRPSRARSGGQRRRDPHPAVRERCRQVVDGGSVDFGHRGARRRSACARSRSVVVTTSTRWPRSTSRRTSSRATVTGPPNASAGQ